MKQAISKTALTREDLDKLKINDPIVKLHVDSLLLLPQYFNYSFVSMYCFLFIPFILLFAQKDPKFHLAAVGLILCWIYVILTLLKSSNSVRFDINSRLLTVIPPRILKPVKKKKVIPFKEIDFFDFKDNGAIGGDIRYIIYCSSKEETINLASTGSEINSIALLKIIRQLTK